MIDFYLNAIRVKIKMADISTLMVNDRHNRTKPETLTKHTPDSFDIKSTLYNKMHQMKIILLILVITLAIYICRIPVPGRLNILSRNIILKNLNLLRTSQHVQHGAQCPDVEQLAFGQWERWNASQIRLSDVQDVESYHKRQWQYLGLPQSIQRADNKCGNLAYRGGFWVARANCDPKGKTPCCYDNVCQAKTIEECRCKGCYDLRREVMAEFANWVPHNKKCKVVY